MAVRAGSLSKGACLTAFFVRGSTCNSSFFALQYSTEYPGYGRFLETNANSLHFSVFASVTFVAAAAVDLLLLSVIVMKTNDIMVAVEMAGQLAEADGLITNGMSRTISLAEAAGIGESIDLFFIAPLVLLYSYTRKHRDTVIDMAIPMAGAAAIVALYAEAFFRVSCRLPEVLNMYLQSKFGFDLSQISIAELKQMLMMLIE